MRNYKQTQEAALDKIILKFFSTYSFILFRSLCIDRFYLFGTHARNNMLLLPESRDPRKRAVWLKEKRYFPAKCCCSWSGQK